VILTVLAGVGVYFSGERLVAVRVSLLPGAEEAGDRRVLGLGGGSAAPDYRLEVDAGDGWIDCGTFLDTEVGDGLRFELPAALSAPSVRELRLLDQDRLADDELERVVVEGERVEGEAYAFLMERKWDLQTGVEAFLGTPLGILVTLGIGVALLVVVLGAAVRKQFE